MRRERLGRVDTGSTRADPNVRKVAILECRDLAHSYRLVRWWPE